MLLGVGFLSYGQIKSDAELRVGRTAEAVARKYDVDRSAQDEFAAESQRRAGTTAARAAFAKALGLSTTPDAEVSDKFLIYMGGRTLQTIYEPQL